MKKLCRKLCLLFLLVVNFTPIANASPPVVLTPPQSQTVTVGSDVTFSVSMGGTAPFSYRWRYNNFSIPFATNASLTLENVHEEDAGNFSVVISNIYGVVVAGPAALAVQPGMPIIKKQPASTSTTNGGPASFSVAVSGSDPLNFQWQLNGANIPGATGGSYVKSNVRVADVGDYRVMVGNAHGSVTSAPAQLRIEITPAFQWARKAGGSSTDEASAMVVDEAGNSYVTGSYGSTNAVFGTNNLTGVANRTNMFLGKYDVAGNLEWVKKVESSQHIVGRAMARDTASNLYIAGIFKGNPNFGAFTLTNSSPFWHGFVAKFDDMGNSLWAKHLGFPNGSNNVTSGAVDLGGNIYLTGSFEGPMNFGGGVTMTNSPGGQNTDAFVVKFGPSGDVIWARRSQGGSVEQANGVAVDGTGNVYIAGSFTGGPIFDNFFLTNALVPSFPSTPSVFIAKYDSAGNIIYAKKGADSALGTAQAIAVDESNNIFITAYKADYGTNVALAKYDTVGDLLWSKKWVLSCCSGDYMSVPAVAVDANGSVYVATGGKFSTTYGNWDGIASSLNFVAKYGADGSLLWQVPTLAYAKGIGVDGSNNVYLTGQIYGNAAFGSTVLSASGLWDVFVARLGVTPPAVNVAVTNFTVVEGTGKTLSVSVTGMGPFAYQWLFNGVNILGATNVALNLSDFNWSKNGVYSVVVKNGAGMTTSAPIYVTAIPILHAAENSGQLIFRWQGPYVLQSATKVMGPFVDVSTAVSPYTNEMAAEPGMFFRLRQ